MLFRALRIKVGDASHIWLPLSSIRPITMAELVLAMFCSKKALTAAASACVNKFGDAAFAELDQNNTAKKNVKAEKRRITIILQERVGQLPAI